MGLVLNLFTHLRGEMCTVKNKIVLCLVLTMDHMVLCFRTSTSLSVRQLSDVTMVSTDARWCSMEVLFNSSHAK